MPTTTMVGSLDALRAWADLLVRETIRPGADVVVVPTAAAFTGITESALAVAAKLEHLEYRVEALMVADRRGAAEQHFADRITAADLVVLCDGSPLHARSTWRETPLSSALANARSLVCVGWTASVLGDVMIDPRGGAPTTGLGLVHGVAFAMAMGDEQTTRTRSLLAASDALVVLGPRGVVSFDGERWRVLDDDVIVTRGHEHATL